MTDPISLDITGSIARIRINRPDRRNALTVDMWEAIQANVCKAQVDPSVRAVVLMSAVPGVFSAGADLGDMKRAMTDDAFSARNLAAIKGASDQMAACPIPTVALVNGMCFGGATALIASCDIRLAGQDASFATTPAKLGLAYPISDTARLVALMGIARTKRMLFTGDQITAAKAYDYGLVDENFEDFAHESEAFLERMTSRSLFSQWRSKAQIRSLADAASLSDDDHFVAAQTGPDAAEGMAAFAEKRAPQFTWRLSD